MGLLKVGIVRPIEKEGNGIVCAKMIVYSGEDEEYYTYFEGRFFH
jgi:hypothetical protein